MAKALVVVVGLFFLVGVHAAQFHASPVTSQCRGLSADEVRAVWHPDGRLEVRTIRRVAVGLSAKSVFAAQVGPYVLAIYDEYSATNGDAAACSRPHELIWTFEKAAKRNYSATVWSLHGVQIAVVLAAILTAVLALVAFLNHRAKHKATDAVPRVGATP